MTGKEKLLYVIKNKGACYEIDCYIGGEKCPLLYHCRGYGKHRYSSVEELLHWRYSNSLATYSKEYGIDNLKMDLVSIVI